MDSLKTNMSIPLAERMRPASFDEFLGQDNIAGKDRPLLRAIAKGNLPSLIIWGPPGSGKTTLANLIARNIDAHFASISAVLSGVKEVRAIMERAAELKAQGRDTILFVDEVHRFNKAQQDAFLHHIEDGTIKFIGATTENPSFEVVSPLLSRCKVLVLKAHSGETLVNILENALKDRGRGLGDIPIDLEEGVLEFIASSAHGDARSALGRLEELAACTQQYDDGRLHISLADAEEILAKKALLYDKGGEEHYNVISSFIKSMRASDPDAALYWLARMLEAGEDPLFVARRMVIFASEDVGNADPRAISVALAAKDAFHFVGMPEGWIPLAQAATYLATAPKSNASYAGYKEALKDVKALGALPVPMVFRNAPTRLMKDIGYGDGYIYPHDDAQGYSGQSGLPEKLKNRKYYRPTDRGYEQRIKERMEHLKGLGKGKD